MVSQRKLLKAGSAGLLASLISPWSFAQTAPALLQGARQRQFTRVMPNPLDPANLFAPDSFLGRSYTLRIREFQAALGLTDPATGAALNTTLWGYGSNSQAPSYPGRTFNVRRGIPITVRYVNELLNSAGPLPHRLPVDTTIDWANPGNLGGRAAEEAQGQVRWLRPDYQHPGAAAPSQQAAIDTPDEAAVEPAAATAAKSAAGKAAWPKTMREQIAAVLASLHPGPLDAATVAASFKRSPMASVQAVLDALEDLGRVHHEAGLYRRLD